MQILRSPGKILLGIQRNSEHPLAEPVVRYLDEFRYKKRFAVSDIESITGKGIKSSQLTINHIYVGNRKMMDETEYSDRIMI